MTAEREGVAERWVAHIPSALRRACGHDSRSVEGCLNCEAADHIEALDAAIRALRQGGEPVAWLYLFPHDGETDHALSLTRFLPSWVAAKGATETPLYAAPPSPAKEG